jgi:hypothetical protein
MPQAMTGVLVVIASPGDAAEERATVRDALVDWNISRGRREGVALLPWLWERHAVPRMGDRPQALINSQAVDQADVVVAFFDSKLGSATGVDVSGTAEEINRGIDMGKSVHVYFSEEDLPRDVDQEQLVALRAFQTELQERGVLGSYSDPKDLAAQVVRAVDADLAEADWSTARAHPGAVERQGAVLVWEHRQEREPYHDSKGRLNHRTKINDLVVTNEGDADADEMSFTVEAVGDTGFAFPEPPTEPVTIHQGSSMGWLLIPTPSLGNSGNTVRIEAKWTEDGEPKGHTRTVVLRG